mmetsp:Transcript_21229/g.68725  ORF Transcript_21229/g.68725 Transcript_21229/m.68725 type:complete len:208 (-) Transcript_21229:151-774(-)
MRLSRVAIPKRFAFSWISNASMSNAMPSYTWSSESRQMPSIFNSSPSSWMRFHTSCQAARIGNPFRQVLYPAGALGEHCVLANCSQHVFLLLITSISARSHLAWEAGVPQRRRAAATPSRPSVHFLGAHSVVEALPLLAPSSLIQVLSGANHSLDVHISAPQRRHFSSKSSTSRRYFTPFTMWISMFTLLLHFPLVSHACQSPGALP